MLAASPLPPLLAPSGAAAAPLPSPALAQTPAVSALTYFATPPSIASNQLLNQRAANGGTSAAPAASSGAAVMSSGGLQPAPLRSAVVQEFGYSSAFMAQLIDQSSASGLSAALRTPTYRNVGVDSPTMADVKYMPSKAAVPIEIPPMMQLAQRPATMRTEAAQSGPSVIEAMRSAPTRSAAELLSTQQSIQLNVATLAQGIAPAVYAVVPMAQPVRQDVAVQVKTPDSSEPDVPVSERPASEGKGGAPRLSARVQQAVSAYQQAVSRLGSYTPTEAANPDVIPVEATSAVA